MKGNVQLNPRVQAQLLEQMREEQAAAYRGRLFRRFVLLPLFLGAFVWSAMMALYGDGMEVHIGGSILSSLLWFLWLVRKRVPAMFGFD